MLKAVWRGSIAGINAIIAFVSRFVLRYGSRPLIKTRVRVNVEGLEHVPRSGSVLLAARHYHHFYDGCILLAVMPRRIHLFVALDWARTQRTRRLMEYICQLGEWPVSLREERFDAANEAQKQEQQSIYSPDEVRRYVLHSSKQTVQLLRQGEALVIFPEAYPNIDPMPTGNPKSDGRAFLPFRPGFAKLVEMAERNGRTPVPIIPVGFMYHRNRNKRWHATVRFGKPLYRTDFSDAQQMVKAVEERVRTLSS